uniref:Uncharacterized protein n=1 Tax=Romanomermis culicivorax TaxID=13658 RepID=A0A915HST1_ROMCU
MAINESTPAATDKVKGPPLLLLSLVSVGSPNAKYRSFLGPSLGDLGDFLAAASFLPVKVAPPTPASDEPWVLDDDQKCFQKISVKNSNLDDNF